MKAKVTAIESASLYTDGLRRVMMRFETADGLYKELRVKVTELPFAVAIDDEIEVSFAKVDPLKLSAKAVVEMTQAQRGDAGKR